MLAAATEHPGPPWCRIETYRYHSALAAIVVALGDAGGFYVDDISIEVVSSGTTAQGGAG